MGFFLKKIRRVFLSILGYKLMKGQIFKIGFSEDLLIKLPKIMLVLENVKKEN